MSDEELERKMEFIIDQQAQSSAKIGVLEDIVTRLGNATLRRVEEIDDKINVLIDSQIRTDKRFEDGDEKISALIDSQIRTDKRFEDGAEKINTLIDSQIMLAESQVKLAEAQAKLTEAQARTDESMLLTDEKLRNLIGLVDRYLSGNGRGGNQ